MRDFLLLFFLQFLLFQDLEVDDPVSVIYDAPAKLFEGDGLEQLILAVSQIYANFAFQDVAAVEIEWRPPRLNFRGILLLLLLFLPLLVVGFLALGNSGARLCRSRCLCWSSMRARTTFFWVARGIVTDCCGLRAACP